jgi:hypothetical protein
MDTKSSQLRQTFSARRNSIDLFGIATWLLGFGLVSWLGLKDGGFDPLNFERVGVLVWWIVFAGLALALLPARRLGTFAWISLGLFTVFSLWAALSLAWTESPDKTSTEVARVASYLGVFGLAVFVRTGRSARRMTSAVATAIVMIACVALLSRLHPSWFPDAADTGKVLFTEANRLAFPVAYWNGLGALLAIGLVLLLNTAATAKSILARSVSVAALPVIFLTLYFTLSRGSFLAAGAALVLYFILTPDRLPKALTLLVGAAGGTILILAARQNSDLADGLLNSTAQDQGTNILALTIAIVVITGIIFFVASRLLKNWTRPSWLVPGRIQSLMVIGVAAVVLLIGLIAAGATTTLSNSWSDFKSDQGVSDTAIRLESASGNGRYQYWSSAVKEFKTEPVTGTGSGTFEYWWAENGDRPGFVRDTHSLYFQTLGELGLVGILLLGGFLLAVLIGGSIATLRSSARGRPQLSAAVAGCFAFCVSAMFDWIWLIPVLPIIFLLLASVLVTTDIRRPENQQAYRWGPRVAMAAGCLVAIIAISIPLASAVLVDESEADFESGNLQTALVAARNAAAVQPSTAKPHLQAALILEEIGNTNAAIREARIATSKEPVNWRNWLIRSRLEGLSGQTSESVRSYQKASQLNRLSPIFESE